MYSPKIPDRLIPPLYRLGQVQRRPMTHLVAEAVEHYLASAGYASADLCIDDGDGHLDQRRAA